MRNIAGLLLIVSFVLHLLVGGGALISAQYEELNARAEAGDLSDVAGDIVDERTLVRERQAGSARAETGGAARKRMLGVVLFVLGLAQLVSAVLLFLRRGRRFVLGAVVLSISAVILVMVLGSMSAIALISLAVLVVALVLAVLSTGSSATTAAGSPT